MDNEKIEKEMGRLRLTLLLMMFLVLKLTGAIDWDWWWVLTPVWIPAVWALLRFLAVAIAKAISNRR